MAIAEKNAIQIVSKMLLRVCILFKYADIQYMIYYYMLNVISDWEKSKLIFVSRGILIC